MRACLPSASQLSEAARPTQGRKRVMQKGGQWVDCALHHHFGVQSHMKGDGILIRLERQLRCPVAQVALVPAPAACSSARP